MSKLRDNTASTWASPAALTGAWAAVVAYGSLLPLEFDVAGFAERHGGGWSAVWAWLSSPQWKHAGQGVSSLGIPTWQSDLALNLLLYVPLGLLLRWTLLQRGRGGAAGQIALVATVVAAMSWLLEATQALAPMRVASLNDFVANVCPAIAAAVAAPLVREVVRWLARRVSVLVDEAVCGVGRLRRRPMVLPTLVGLVLLAALPMSLRSGGESTTTCLPFAAAFARSYDVAAWQLAGTAAAYAGLFALMLAALGRRGAWLVAPLMAGGALLVQVVRATVAGAPMELGDPILAAGVAMALLAVVLRVERVARAYIVRHGRTW